MITDNFRNGNEMNKENNEYDEFRYQHRGYAKYPDLARLHPNGWNVWSEFWRQEHLEYNQGTEQ